MITPDAIYPEEYQSSFTNRKGETVKIKDMSDSYLLNAYKYFKGRALLISLEAGGLKKNKRWDEAELDYIEEHVDDLKELICSFKYHIIKRGLKIYEIK